MGVNLLVAHATYIDYIWRLWHRFCNRVRKKSIMIIKCSIVLIATLLACIGCGAQSRSINRTTVSNLDVERYMGRWYEIARYDHRFERHLERCEAYYTLLPDGKISVVNTGIDSRTGLPKTAYGKGRTTKTPGRLRVSFFLFFYSDYNILALDKDYRWVLVGSRSPKYLWILSRTPTLEREQLDEILNIARSRGYDTSKLLYVQ